LHRDEIPMTSAEIRAAVADYARGLDSELAVLNRLDASSRVQLEATRSQDLIEVVRVSAEREETMRALNDIEKGLAPVRAQIGRHLELARASTGFPALSAAHRRAEALITTIVARDHETIVLLKDTDCARRLAAHAIETGEATLAAYRKVIAPTLSSAGLVSRRG
jgi:hypothetical protein